MLVLPKPVQDSLSNTLLHKETMGQNTSRKRVLATAPSFEVAHGYDTSTKDVLGYIPSVQKALDPILCEQGAIVHDMHTQVSVASFTSKEGDSLNSIYAQESMGPTQTLQEAMETSLFPKENQ